MVIRADVLEGPFDPNGQPDTRTGQPMELALFAWNVQGGLSATKAVLADPKRYRDYWHWASASRLLREAERIGFDHQVPYGMWSGYGGQSGWNDAGFDFATAATASAVITNRLGVFSTVHVGYKFHPMHIAKIGACIDFLSEGRWGLNIVAGSNPADFAKFGMSKVPSGEERYALADEFTTLMKYLWTSDSPVDFEGDYFQCYGGYIAPKPKRQPRPVLMNAGGSGAGFDFACRQADWVFVAPPKGTPRDYAYLAKKARELAVDYGRVIRVAAMCYVVVEESDDQAEEVVGWLKQEADTDAIRTFILAMTGTSVELDKTGDVHNDPFVGVGEEMFLRTCMGMGGYQIVGGPATVVEQVQLLYDSGVEMLALGFFDPVKGLALMESQVLPRLRAIGLRK